MTEKLFFGVFLVFFLFLLFFPFCVFWGFCFLWFFWEGLGSGEVARRATSLGPKPSLFLFLFFCFVFLFWGAFPFLVFNRKKACFPRRKGHFLFIFESPPLFLLSLFWPPPFSVSLSLSLLLLLSFFLPSCLYFFFGSLFLSLSFFFCLLCFLLHEKNNIKRFNCNFFFSSIFSLFLVSCLVFPFKSLFLNFVFLPDFKLCFFVQHECFWFQNKTA